MSLEGELRLAGFMLPDGTDLKSCWNHLLKMLRLIYSCLSTHYVMNIRLISSAPEHLADQCQTFGRHSYCRLRLVPTHGQCHRSQGDPGHPRVCRWVIQSLKTLILLSLFNFSITLYITTNWGHVLWFQHQRSWTMNPLALQQTCGKCSTLAKNMSTHFSVNSKLPHCGTNKWNIF